VRCIFHDPWGMSTPIVVRMTERTGLAERLKRLGYTIVCLSDWAPLQVGFNLNRKTSGPPYIRQRKCAPQGLKTGNQVSRLL
jgi:hypothetical protein